ncbi:MAG TPA: amino acid adenylation domain-containing protein [Kofleriaceae bacterium]
MSREERERPFDLASDPLLRTLVIRSAPDEHVLFATLHHIVADGLSIAVLWHDLEELYSARVTARSTALVPLAVHYADYATWQRGWLAGDVLDEQLAYWKEHLAGAPEETALPIKGPRPPLQTHNGGSASIALDRDLVAALRKLSSTSGCTLFITLLAGFRALLARYTGQDDLCIGAPTANRNQRETEHLVGLFVNTLVLRTPTTPAMTFSELLANERATALAAFAHAEAPFEMIVEALGVARSLARNPLFQVMFQVQFVDDTAPAAGFAGLTDDTIERGLISTHVDLDVSAVVRADGAEVVLVYNTDLFDASTIADLATHFRALLHAAVAQPETRVAELPLLSSAESEQIAHGWNHTARDVPAQTLPELIDARAAATPTAIAIVGAQGSLTYAELVARSNRLAHSLVERGVVREERVAIQIDRGPDLVVAMLGVLKAGGAYLPIDSELPADRIAFMTSDAGVRITLTEVDLATSGSTAPLPPPSPHQLAYVLYTSGSTGRPKGVHIQHGSLVNFLVSMLDAPGLTARDTLLAVTTASFDISGLELYLPLVAGGRVHIATRDQARDAAQLQALLLQSGATVMQATPSTWQMLVETDWRGRDGFVALVGGEALPPALAASLGSRVAALWNVYGPTETTIWSARKRMVPGEPIRLGEPIANTSLYILDSASLTVQPLEVAGELFIGGEGLARGYGGRPDLTAERFLPDPFSSVPGARMYRTGDRVRRRSSGEIEFLGRIDHQVKIRGFRIELGEIEAVLADHPNVAEVVVVVREDGGVPRLVAYAVTLGTVPAEDLLALARERLPDYMVPSAVVFLDELPLSPAGKIDRRALPAPDRTAFVAASYQAPRNPIEEILVGIWVEQLAVERVGIHDNFFELGGHSLLAVRVLWAVNRAFTIQLPLERIFTSPSVAELAVAVASAQRAGSALPAITVADRGESLPLSYSQQRMWFLNQLEHGTAAYNIATGYRLQGPLDVEALRRAFEATVQRHEVLRTLFPSERGAPRQVIRDLTRWSLPVDDLAAVPLSERQTTIDRLSREEGRAPFDLGADLPLRTRVLRLAPEDHIVLATMHHIVTDGSSFEPFWADVVHHYTANLRGTPATLAPLPLQYADYAAWQRRWFAGDALDEQLAYWKQRLAGAPQETALPFKGPRPPVQTFGGAYAAITLERDIADGLAQLARRQGATVVMALLAGLRALLYRYTGQEDLSIGVPTANRRDPAVERMVGLFVNTVVLRAPASPDASFAELVAAERTTALEAYAHQDTPFEMVVDALGVERAVNRTPLFQILFQAWFEQGSNIADTWGDATATIFERTKGSTHLDLDISGIIRDDGIELAFLYNTDLFEHDTIAQLAEHYRAFLRAALADPAQRISAVPLLSPAERTLVLETWNATKRTYTEPLVPSLVEAQVDRTPDAIAVSFEAASITYRELDERANRLAHHLTAQRERVIGIRLERSIDMIVTLIAIHKAGAAYMPIDPAYPALRVQSMLDDAACTLVIDHAWLASHATAIAACSPARPRVTIDAENAAYVMFTSGSTGRPKGAVITHAGLRNRLLWVSDTFAFAADDRVLQKTPFTFDVSVFELFYPFIRGARLVLARPDGHRDPAYLAQLIRDEKITFAHFVPSMLGPFLDAAKTIPSTSLRRVFCSGEALSTSLVRRFGSLFSAELYNLYGPTEATIDVSWWRCDTQRQRATVPIGIPVANTRLYVLDRELQPVPVGAAGELFIAGVQLARGYSLRPDLTAARFIPDPFHAGERMYRTGDLARYQRDGALEYLGRIDQQVKLRGLRIELEEIEAVLRTHPAISDAVVVVKQDHLVAYLAGAATTEQLVDHARARLPEYMLPAQLVFLDALPLTTSGKVDRAQLPEPTWTTQDAYVAPRDDMEQALVEIWQQVLGAPRVGVRDNFFALGGHSLLAARLAWEAQVPISTVFAAPTIAELAHAIRARAGDRSSVPPIARVDRTVPLPLSYPQQRMWVLHQLEEESSAYHITLAQSLHGSLDVAALGRAFDQLITRHEMLRTTFPAPDGTPQQVVHAEPTWCLTSVDLSSRSPDERGAELSRIRTTESTARFDLATGPLVRARVIKVAPAEHVLYLTMHHIVTDGVSVDLLWRELIELYAAAIEQRPAAVPALAAQYGDYAVWQRGWLTGDVLATQLRYWTRKLASAPEETSLPLMGPRPPVQSHRGAVHSIRIDAELGVALQALSRTHGTTLFVTLLAALRSLLARYTGQTDVCIGAPSANRNQREVESLIGLFMNTIVLRTPIGDGASFTDVLAAERTTVLEAFAHAETPFEMIVDALDVTRSLARNPVFQVMFQLRFDDAGTAAAPPGVSVEPTERPAIATQLDLEIAAVVTNGAIDLQFVYSTDLFDARTIESLAEHLRVALGLVAADPQRAVATLPLLSSNETDQFAQGWNDTAREIPAQTLPELIDARAAATPDAIAIVGAQGSLTYAELVARSNQLAHSLVARGLAREERVAIQLDRGPELVVAMLGVLKAGGAYLPIDTELPADRIAYMKTDAGVRITLAQGDLPTSGSAAPLPPPSRHQLAYVLYTSGSTGRPKGVQIQHASLVNFIVSMLDAPGLTARDTLLAVTTASFDISGLELYLPLVAGARVHIATRDQARDASQLQALVTQSGATMMQATPATWQMLVENDWPGRADFIALVGGEALPPALAASLAPRVAALWNMYGPTETTIWSARKRILAGEPIRLGEPIANTSLYVLEPRSLLLQPLDVAGELFIGGSGLARGYGGRSDLTAERFLPDPFSSVQGARMYRTGDRVRRRSDGELEFLGRVDHQVKIRGFRIELGEIEAVLRSHPCVAEAVVVPHQRAGGDVLVAYVVGNHPASELLDHARAALPDYMVPTAIVFVTALPLSSAGKIDRAALPAPTWASEDTHVAPRNAVEEQLVAIWTELLQTRVGVRDVFFDLGGHSLLAMRVLAQVRRRFGIDLSVRSFFEAPTIEALARQISSHTAQSAPLVVSPRPPFPPLSFAQERMWYLTQLDPESAAYVLSDVQRFDDLDPEIFRRAFAALIERHEVLRTSFPLEKGRPYQRVHAPSPWTLPVQDARELDDARQAALIDEIILGQQQHLDLANGPLLLGDLLRITERGYVLVLSLHHIITDGWSQALLRRELWELYEALVAGRAPALEPLTIQYADYSVWERCTLVGAELERHLAFWTSRLSGAPAETALPFAGPRPEEPTYRSAGITTRCDAQTSAKLRALATRDGASLFMTLLAALRALLARTTGQGDLVIGTPIANRSHHELEGLLGYFANTLALRGQVDMEAPFSTLLARERDGVLAAFDHQNTPFELVVNALRLPRRSGVSPLFQVFFVHQNFRVHSGAPSALTLDDSGTSEFDLAVWSHQDGETIVFAWQYNPDLFDASTMEQLFADYHALLAAIAETPEGPLVDLLTRGRT